MTSTREKLVAALNMPHPSQRSDVLDALEAIVQEARNEAIEECARFVEGGSFLHADAPAAKFARECSKAMRQQLLRGE